MERFDEEFDFVVVGSGGGSMCSALVMRAAGKSVVILEKTDLIGGSTARSGGVMWIPNNRFMAEDGIGDSEENALVYMDATAGQSENAPGTTPERRKAYVTEAPRMVDFLVSEGIKLGRPSSWPDYYDERPGGSVPGRTVVADVFDLNELGEWKQKLRPTFMPIPASHSEAFELSTFKSSWRGKFTMLKVGLRATLAKLFGKDLAPAGAALQGRMLKRSLEVGVDLRINTGVKTFITEEGAVKGVVTVRDGRDWHIGARLGVLVNAGGFAHAQDMLDKYIPGVSIKWTASSPGDTGEMLNELMKLGAATGQLDEMVGNQMSIPPGRENNGTGVVLGSVSGQMQYTKPHSIVVDQSGARYLNEAGSYMAFCQNMLRRNLEVPAIPSWWIFDEQYMRSYMYCGTMPGTPKPAAWYDAGFLIKADSLEDLAVKLKIPGEALTATVQRFNAGAREGRDPQFHRGERAYDRWLGDAYHSPSATLGTIEEAPFYATPVVPGNVGTFGGVVTDAYARVLREDNTPIPGLYATGNTTASVMGRVYPGAGSSIGPAFTWGFVAAKHACGRDYRLRVV